MKKPTKKYIPNISTSKVEEPAAVYHITPKRGQVETLVKDFTYNDFKKFLQKELLPSENGLICFL